MLSIIDQINRHHPSDVLQPTLITEVCPGVALTQMQASERAGGWAGSSQGRRREVMQVTRWEAKRGNSRGKGAYTPSKGSYRPLHVGKRAATPSLRLKRRLKPRQFGLVDPTRCAIISLPVPTTHPLHRVPFHWNGTPVGSILPLSSQMFVNITQYRGCVGIGEVVSPEHGK